MFKSMVDRYLLDQNTLSIFDRTDNFYAVADSAKSSKMLTTWLSANSADVGLLVSTALSDIAANVPYSEPFCDSTSSVTFSLAGGLLQFGDQVVGGGFSFISV